jgi:nicotinate-nucleotide adenylyltransferase
MEFFLRATAKPSPHEPHKLGVFPGSFNPPTKAHLALAEAALGCVHEVVFTLPKVFPHKPYDGASFDERVDMLTSAVAGNPALSVAATGAGLFLEIAQECRAHYADAELHFLCGRDAAERILTWDYGQPGVIDSFLGSHRLLVAARDGEFEPPLRFASAIRQLPLARDWSEVSSTEIRTRIAQDLPWEHLAPPGLASQIRRIYGSRQHEIA